MKENIMNVEDVFLTDWDVKILLKNEFENRRLTKDEILNIKALHETALMYCFEKELVFGIGKNNCHCITKVYDSIWATYYVDRDNNINDYIAFRNCKSACINIINKQGLLKLEAIDYFNFTLKNGFVDEELKCFAKDFNYIIINEDKKLTKRLK